MWQVNRMTGYAAVAIAMLVAVSVARANVLSAPGFEAAQGAPDASLGDQSTNQAGSPWAGWQNWVPSYGAFYTTTVAHSGTQSGKTFSDMGGLYQFQPATAGQQYTGSAWFMNSSLDPMSVATQTADVRLTFFDGPNGTGNNLGVTISPAINGTGIRDVWTQLTANATAPAGTQSVQFLAFYINPTFAGGSVFVDDASLAAVPEPARGLLALGGLLLVRRTRRV